MIGTESSFNIDPPGNKTARGLMQIMPNTRIYLQDIHGELTNHLVRVTAPELMEPSANICAGIRWLFRKIELAKGKLKREPTWIEAVADYKDYLNDMIAGNPYNPKPMNDLKKYYTALQEGIT